MRDAFGGLFMFNLFIIFIFIFVAFSAVSLTYAKAFRLKNSLITYVEEQEIISLNLDNTKLEGIDKILQGASYHKTCDSLNKRDGFSKSAEGKIDEYCHNGVVIRIKYGYPKKIDGTNSKLIVYEIMTYADWNLGVMNKLLALSGRNGESIDGFWTIKGEAKVVQRG